MKLSLRNWVCLIWCVFPEQWTLQASAFPLTTMISFIKSSAFYLKAFGACDVAEQIHDLFRHLPSIEAMQLRFWFHDKLPTEVLFFELLCSSDETVFLPYLRTLNFSFDLPIWLESLPRIFSASYHQDLRLEVNHNSSTTVIEDGTAERFFELVEEGFNLSVLGCGKVDMIQEYKVNWRSQSEKRLTAQG